MLQLRACAFRCALWPCFRSASGLRLLLIFGPDWRPASTLIACRAPTRPQCNSWLAPQVTRLWQRRRPNPWLAPVVQILRQSWRPVPGSRLDAASPACADCLPPAYFRSLSPSVESWLVSRLAPDSSSLAQLSCDSESRRMLVRWARGLNSSACAAESLSQAYGELSTSTGPCIVG